ncbi:MULTISPECIES: hypothetical protein [unclassified Isoptericola]|uniref:hypothetical protein n=1 Tax=unclassified Isoptericola TaxID=2623355 RepID=UPI00365BE734
MTKQVRMAGGDLRIILPGTWTRIPLDEPQRTLDFVKRFVKRQTGNADRLARVRRETVRELVGSARDASRIGVHSYFMSLEILPGVPFPAALLFLDQDWPEAATPLVAEGDLEGALDAAYGPLETARASSGPVGRRFETLTQRIGEQEMLTLRLEYFVPYPDGSRVLQARVNVPNIPTAEPFAVLFNEIIDSISFAAPETEATPDGSAVDTEAQDARAS